MRLSTVKLTTSFVALASLLSPAFADHELTFNNNCSFDVTPKWTWNRTKDGEIGRKIAPGQSWSAVVPESWMINSYTWGVTDRPGENCNRNEGQGCTQLQCVINGRGKGMCSVLRTNGFNIGMGFDWVGGDADCGLVPKTSTDAKCDKSQACNAIDGCVDGATSYCITPNVGLQITFCP